MTIQFGTDGWRAVIAETFTFENLRLLTQGIADAVSAGDWANGPADFDPRLMVVGFDTRFLSDRFAIEVARVLAANGIRVLLTHADTPTPALSYAVRHHRAAAGVMITASHNAPRYNGVKLKAAFGGSALNDQCRRVEMYLGDNERRARGPNLMDLDKAQAAGLIERFNPLPAYYEHLRSLIDFNLISNNPQRLVVDSMYGSGRGAIRGILAGTGCEVTEIRGDMNPGFGGAHPEPIARHLGPAMGAIADGHGAFAVATDGDADRTGAVDGRGQFVDPHRIISLALRYLYDRRGMRGAVVKTVSTTRMVNRLAQRYGLECIETPVGFNHIADLMLERPVLIGGEESGGISILGHIPEGDGVLFGLLILEMVAASGATLEELVADLIRDVGPALYERRDLRLSRPVAKSEMTRRLSQHAPATIGPLNVASVETMDGVKYVMDDDSWLLIRPSGTEPVLRVYAEGRSEEAVRAMIDFGAGLAQS
ncbi:MAG TPA: phosphoglucomutase/phosphomannomutase family protein [Anaerolineales bacterium]|nr:phosphoglucomutase/phosphomannomutase family protein [Anaerolineales bacterium]